MSRIGKKPIAIPEKTVVTVAEGSVTVKGPLGELSRKLAPGVSVSVLNSTASVSVDSPLKSAIWGTYGSHIKNMIAGVNTAYVKKLIVEGIGFKADVKSDELVMSLGFSHPVHVPIPAGLKVTSEKNILTISGINKELVGDFTASIRTLKKPEPYKGKGIRYDDEVIRRKQGKKAA